MVEGEETPVISPLNKKIVKQIEYYFGDMNLPRDNFLREEIKKEDGWVHLETMVKFNRLKQLTTDYSVITTALKASGTTFIQVSEDNEKIRRNPDLPVPELTKERTDDLKSRSYYVKGFPLDVTLDTVSEYFEKFGKVDQIQMRKDIKRNFKGSVFVVFNSKEEGEKFFSIEPLKYDETELKKETRDSYFKRKEEERKVKKEELVQKKIEAKKQEEEAEIKRLNNRMTKGAILCLKKVATGTTREQIRDTFNKFSSVAYIEFNTGDIEARLRFDTEGAASVALEKAKEENEGKISINGGEVEYSILEGAEEVEHWKKIFQEQKERRDMKRKGNFGRGRKHFGGGGWRDSQKRQPNSDNKKAADGGEPTSKKQKTEVEAAS